MNTKQIDLNAAVEEARVRVNDCQGEVSTSTFINNAGQKKVTVTLSITVDAVEKSE